ncbi:MAG: hypothetical protein EOO65_04070, partial [Methanosarcinales archaeon]
MNSFCQKAGATLLTMDEHFINMHLEPIEHATSVASKAWLRDGATLGLSLPFPGFVYVTPQRLFPFSVHYNLLSVLASIERARQEMDNTLTAPWCVQHEAGRLRGARVDAAISARQERSLATVTPSELSQFLPFEGKGDNSLPQHYVNASPPAENMSSRPAVAHRLLMENSGFLPVSDSCSPTNDPKLKVDATIQAISYAATWLTPIVEANIHLPHAGWWAVAFTG